ncbi:Synaptosomal-associated protein 47, partial [Ophiophagus hannah]
MTSQMKVSVVSLRKWDLRNKIMEDNIHIHAWSCSYYLNSEKQWVPGKLLLTPVSVKFTADKSGEILASFPLSSISEIKKESSTLIFSSLTLLESNAKHWFSSLQPNRNVIFNVLEHFWREQLLSPGGARAQAACGQTSKGRELTGLLMGSEKRLEDTAKVLENQGEQFDNIMKGLDKIESEMDVADSKDGVIVHIPVIIGERTDAHVKPGSLTLLVSGLRICNAKSQLLHWFDKRDVDDVRVQTPYEICVRQRFIGKPDICYRLLSAKMPEAIPFLEMQFSKKIQFSEDALRLAQAKRVSPEEILRRLKCLALETETELERQDESLDVITSSVDRATMNIDRQNRRIRKLT